MRGLNDMETGLSVCEGWGEGEVALNSTYLMVAA